MWSGASNNIPAGWALCNGQNGTPNLVDRFIVGAGSSYSVGATGGEATHALSTSEMPSHNHSFSSSSHSHTISLSGLTTNSAGAHTHSFSPALCHDSGNTFQYRVDKDYTMTSAQFECASAGAHTHTISGNASIGNASVYGSIGSTGSGTAHENRPPYYALCFIMKL